MNEKELGRKGKYMSLLLRHNPEKESLEMNKQGYVKVSQLCSALNISTEELDWIVENNNKKRFEFFNYKKMIRATQGHSFKIDYGYVPVEPPNRLYHGTTYDNYLKINNNGLLKMNRQHVHLSDDLATAKQVGLRHAKNEGNLWIIEIRTNDMHKDGYGFYLSSNNVWLTDTVPSKYFKNES